MQKRKVSAEKSEMEDVTSSEGSDSDSDALEEFTKTFMSKISDQKKRKADKGEPNASDQDESDTDEGTDGTEGDDNLSTEDDDSEEENEKDSENVNHGIGSMESSSKKSDLNTKTLRQQSVTKLKHDLLASQQTIDRKRVTDSETSTSDTNSHTSDDSDANSEDGRAVGLKQQTDSNVPREDSEPQTESDSVTSQSGSGDDEEDEQSASNEELSPPEDTTDSTADFNKLREELAHLPFTELQKLKETIGIKAYNQAMFGTSGTSRTSNKKKSFTRDNKNRPSELSSKRSVPRFRQVVQVKKKTSRDPRFDDLSGEFDEKVFKQSYSFLGDIKQREKQKLLSTYHKEKDEEKKKQMQDLIRRMNQQDRSEREKEQRLAKEQTRKRKEMEQVKQGKQPFHLKKAEKRELELAEKFRELDKSGKVDKYLAKKRKKNASKDRKHLPNKHFVS